jgi:sugar diacid utilization regulator
MAIAGDSATAALRIALQERLDALADAATDRILDEIPAYRDADARLREDVHAHVHAHLAASIASLDGDGDITRDDLLFVRPHAARRARRVAISDFVRAFYVGERVLWETALALAEDDDELRDAVFVLATRLPRYFEVATTHAAEVYLETQEQLAATGERIRRDLLEDLLAGHEPEPGPRADLARAAGLRADAPCVVISATPSVGLDDEQLLRGAASGLARAAGGRLAPLAVVRQNEVVVIVPSGSDEAASPLAERLETAQRRLAAAGLPLAVGVSTTVPGSAEIPAAYREARSVRGTEPGVAALSAMTAFDYLTWRPDPTAGRLIAPEIHAFVAEDTGEGGALIATVRAYADCDLNARRAAQALHIHVNTAHYRLARIAERTGRDLHRVQDLVEILIAARLAEASARS